MTDKNDIDPEMDQPANSDMDGNTDADGVQILAPAPKRGIAKRLRDYFLTGVVVSAPIGITIYLTWALISFVDETIKPLIPERYNPESYFSLSFPGLGLLIMVVLLTLLGALTANFFGRTLLGYGERVVARMPVVRNIYKALKQIFETVATQSAGSFRQAGLIEYPRKGIWSICFITANTNGEVQGRSHEDLASVFVPTTPNPTSGFLLFLPRKDIIILDMSVEEAAKLVISAGMVVPDWHPDPQKPLRKLQFSREEQF